MGKYIKLFEEHEDYEAYMSGNDVVLPNTSFCKDQQGVTHYNPRPETRLVATFSVTNTSSATQIMYNGATSQFSQIEIDGVVQPNVVSSYTFDTTGEHTVKYTLVDNASIGANALQNCSSLTSIIMPNSITSIGEYAFSKCTVLSEIAMPNFVTTINEGAFASCSSLTSITIPNSVTFISDYVFINCTSLENIIVESENTIYDSRNNCNAIIETSTNTLTVGCQNTVIPNSVTTIGNYAFYGCTVLTSITIPNSVTSIDEDAFGRCSGLTNVTMGNSVTSIGVGAFQYCTSLVSVTVEATTPSTLGTSVFANNASGRKIYVPAETVNAYKTASGWSTYANDIYPIE